MAISQSHIRIYPLLLLICLLGACASRPPLPEGERSRAWMQYRERVSSLTQWQLRGRIAIRLEKEGWTASLHWQQEQASYVMRLIAPLGQGTYALRGDASSAQLRTPDNRLLYAQDAQALLEENLGWQVPVRGLAYWVRGLPAPGSTPESLSLDDRGRLADLRQDGWQVHYDRYRLFSNGMMLPEKLTIERPDLRLRLMIHTWEV